MKEVKFYLRELKNQHQKGGRFNGAQLYSIELRLYYTIVKNQRTEFSYRPGVVVPKECWDDISEQVVFVTKDKARRMNERLETDKKYIETLYDKYFNENRVGPTKEWLKNEVSKKNKGRVKRKKQLSFAEFCEKRIKQLKADKKAHKMAYRAYQKPYSKVLLYQDVNKIKVDWDDFNIEILQDFQDFCMEMGKDGVIGLSQSYAAKVMKDLKSVIKEGSADGHHANRIYEHKNFYTIQEEYSDDVFNDYYELEKIYKAKCMTTMQEIVRDYFIIGSFCGGQRVSDVAEIKNKKIEKISGVNCFRLKQKKTGNPLYLPLFEWVQDIFNKYNGELPDFPHRYTFNKEIKKVAALAGLRDVVYLEKSVNGKKQEVGKMKWQWMTSKTMRKNFSSNAFLAGMSAEWIMNYTGHKTEDQLMAYITKAAQIKRAKILAKEGVVTQWKSAADKL